jgi:CheY-like chemotaxis protein
VREHGRVRLAAGDVTLGARRWSNETDSLNFSINAAGPAVKRPPQVTALGEGQERISLQNLHLHSLKPANKPATVTETPQPGCRNPPSMKRILIIDDEEPIRSTVGLILQAAGYNTLEADSGETGLALAREHLPDLTFCDVNMPKMDGQAVVRAFRTDPDLSTRQIVIMTGNPTKTTHRTAMNLGADDYLAKPFTADDIIRCAENRLKRADVHWRVENKTLQDLRGALRSTLPHEFFTPLVGIIGMSELIMEEAGQLSKTELVEMATDIQRSGQRLHRTLRNYLKILELDEVINSASPLPAAPLTADLTRQTVDIAIRNVALRHKREADLQVAQEPCTPGIGPNSLALIVEELAENAFGFSRQGTPVQLTLRPEAGQSQLENRCSIQLSYHRITEWQRYRLR